MAHDTEAIRQSKYHRQILQKYLHADVWHQHFKGPGLQGECPKPHLLLLSSVLLCVLACTGLNSHWNSKRV